MKSVINEIFTGNSDESVHSDFIKYSKGVFENRYLLEGKKQKDKWQIKTSSEFVNFIVRKCLDKVKGIVNVKGIIVCTNDIEKDIDFEIKDIKKYMGIKQYVIETEVQPEKIIELMEKHPRVFYALSFSYGDFELKVKAKPPKRGKPRNKIKDDENEGPKADFCSLKTTDKEIISDLFFDFPDFNEIKINHTIEIKEIEIPRDAKTPEEMREKAKRKGIIKRFIEVDGRKEVKDKEFEA